jgi:hypothetical protein
MTCNAASLLGGVTLLYPLNWARDRRIYEIS